jgi:hypothetical protein
MQLMYRYNELLPLYRNKKVDILIKVMTKSGSSSQGSGTCAPLQEYHQSLLQQLSQTRTGASHPLLGTGRLLLEHPWQTPWPQSRQWWVFSFGVGNSVLHTKHSLISESGTQ